MKLIWRYVLVTISFALLSTTGYAKAPSKAKLKAKSKTVSQAEAAPPAALATPERNRISEAHLLGVPARPAPKMYPHAGASNDAPSWVPVPAISGALGLFTLDSGQTLPTKGFSFSAYLNKFTRMPGSATFLNVGFNAGVGVRDWLTLFANFEPNRHVHIGAAAPRTQLSLGTPADPVNFPPFPNALAPTLYRRLGPGLRPAYIEDFPFAAHDGNGVGELIVGFQVGILSQRRGNGVNLSLRNDFIIPTQSRFSDLLNSGSQSGQFGYAATFALSRTFSNVATVAANWGYRFTRDPRLNGQHLLTQADQMRVGAGLLFFPESRIQFLNEYNGLIFVGSATPNTTFGARDPVDGIWGVRIYPKRTIALDVGYRYMLNLSNANDRHGFVIKVGTAYWPEKPKPAPRPPVASCSADKSSVYAGSGDTVNVRAHAPSPESFPLTYTWTASGGTVDGSGPEVRWNSSGAAQGTYTVASRVEDGHGGTASCSAEIRVEPRPNRPPTISCTPDRSSVLVGERVNITCDASDPDGDPLTFSWRTSAGQVIGSGPKVQLDTTGGNPGTYTVTARVDDGRGGTADSSVNIDVKAPPPPPQASKVNDCFFSSSSARVDNVCKRILDDVALRMRNEPRSKVVLVGYADPEWPRSERLARQRGESAADYLAESGIDRARISVRAGAGQLGAGKQNHRLELIWVPEGASY